MIATRERVLFEVVRYLRPLVLNSARVVEAALRPEGLTVGMRAVLELVRDTGEGTVPALGKRLDLPRQGIQRHVNDLLDLGYVETRANPAHRRSVLVALTPSGREVIDRVTKTELGQLATLAADCDDDEIRTAAKVLASLDRDVRRRAVAIDPREGRE